jgi:energy-coupling factor transporter ATP-binding protein EcfA2
MSFDELYSWFKDRPKWIQDCASRVIEKGQLGQDDYSDLLTLCKNEAFGKVVPFSSVKKNILSIEESTRDIRLHSIANVCGVNALHSDKPIEFSEKPICIVYGRNGSGKSGYIRLLKNACGVKNPDTILPNVFKNSEQQLSSDIVYEKEGVLATDKWNGEPLGELYGIEIYDTNCGFTYIKKENEVSYEPFILRLFTEITKSCKYVAKQINDEINLLPSQKPYFPNDLKDTKAFEWYESISENTKQSEAKRQALWNLDDETKFNNLVSRLNEINPEERAKSLRGNIKIIKQILSDLKIITKELADEKWAEFIKLKKEASEKRIIADEDSKKIFSKAPLSGIGSEAWRCLWESARKYSDEYAYKLNKFPNITKDGRCVLCQRKLDKKSTDRFISFEAFVKGDLQKKAIEAENSFKVFLEKFPSIPFFDDIYLKIEATGKNDDETKIMIEEYIIYLEERKKTLLNSNHIHEVTPLPNKKILINLVNYARILRKKAKYYEQDAKGQNRAQLEREVINLKAKLWLSQQKQSIDNEIKRCKKIRQLKNAYRLTDTTALSLKKSELADKLITKAYIKRFENELNELKAGHISVGIKKTRTEVGKVYHKIFVKNTNMITNAMDILSEGESRIVSLAAFLADTEGRKSRSAFIFDDPISSLDHVFEEAVAQRLVKLCQNRQVIVFTHRLSLVNYLNKYAEKYNIKSHTLSLSEYHIGRITDLPINLKNTKNAVNGLLNTDIVKLKKVFKENDLDYYNKSKSICSTIRILLERVVEKDLFNEVITRFSPEVQTKGKIDVLAKITEDDCKFIDCYMTKYSNYEHSQPDEAPIPLPSPEEIENDLKNIKEFIEKLKNRKKN